MLANPEKQLAIQRMQTENLIKFQGVSITLVRATETPDGAGGVIVGDELLSVDGEPRDRFIGGVTYHHLGFDQPTTIGDQKNFTQVLVGTFDDPMKEGDEFEYGGSWYRVGNIIIDRTYETKSECVWLREVD